MIPRALYRAFPWDPAAPAGAPFSAQHRPRSSGAGRFDLPWPIRATTLYLAETPDHAVGELIQDLRNQTLSDDDLVVAGYRLAVCPQYLPPAIAADVPDLCDPATLLERSIRPDELAYRDRRVTQTIAAGVHRSGAAGLRWWSAIVGEWNSVVLFSDRVSAKAMKSGEPRHLELADESVRSACEVLGIRIVH